MYLRIQALPLLLATASAIRHAHFARQLETCGVSCGGGWCCFEFETCVPNPGDTVDGDWSCIIQGVSNADGSPLTDAPFNPSADNALFTSIDGILSDQSAFISSLTSELGITSLSFESVTALPTSSTTPTSLTLAPITSITSPSASSTTTSPSTSPPTPNSSLVTTIGTETSASIPHVKTITGGGSGTLPANTTSSSIPLPSQISMSSSHKLYSRNGYTTAFMLCFAVAVEVYLG